MKLGHIRSHRGHGFDHDVSVAMLGVKIAPRREIAEMAFCAGLLHSIDRNLAKPEGWEQMTKEAQHSFVMVTTRQKSYEYARRLGGILTFTQIDEIVDAAVRHGELNQFDQSVTQVVLMDADRIINLQSPVVIRAGQFMSTLPAFQFEYLDGEKNPESTYYSPQSVLDDLRQNISEYIPKLRIPKAIKLGQHYADRLQSYIDLVEEDNMYLGLAGVTL